jgi:ketosteroid isomerase-like protein
LRSFLLLFLLASACSLGAEEVHLDSCDGLPVIDVAVSGVQSGVQAKMRFLVDTAATSMLNSKSFAHGDSRTLSVTSWSGTVETRSREVSLPELVIGDHRLHDLRLPAVDLSAIGKACGKRIDGILGVDLLSRLGATVDLKHHIAQFVPDPRTTDLKTNDPKTTEAVVAELHQQLTLCEQAFNRADEAAVADCLDPQIVTFTVAGDFYGRDSTLMYYRKTYFEQDPPAQLSMVPRAHHLIGDAVWVEYDLRIVLPGKVVVARGTALCRKSGGKWRIVHMNHSSPPPADLEAHKQEQGGPR